MTDDARHFRVLVSRMLQLHIDIGALLGPETGHGTELSKSLAGELRTLEDSFVRVCSLMLEEAKKSDKARASLPPPEAP
jgi:hypothetical protein